MALRFPFRLAAAACLGMSPLAFAAKPAAPSMTAAHGDQQLADSIASALAQAPTLRGYQVEVTCTGGTVELAGVVRDADQKAEVIKQVRTVAGVKKINDGLSIRDSVTPVQATEPIRQPVSSPVPGTMPFGAMPGGQSLPPGAMMSGPMGGPPGMGGPPAMGGAPATAGGGWGTDPTPMNLPPTGGLYDATPPKMPPYAWPTYAPHNNYSRVGYPTEYPANAFPFIGPFYPFPKVPLGFRAIKLEWEDGHWYYGRTATMRDHWKVRYW